MRYRSVLFRCLSGLLVIGMQVCWGSQVCWSASDHSATVISQNDDSQTSQTNEAEATEQEHEDLRKMLEDAGQNVVYTTSPHVDRKPAVLGKADEISVQPQEPVTSDPDSSGN